MRALIIAYKNDQHLAGYKYVRAGENIYKYI